MFFCFFLVYTLHHVRRGAAILAPRIISHATFGPRCYDEVGTPSVDAIYFPSTLRRISILCLNVLCTKVYQSHGSFKHHERYTGPTFTGPLLVSPPHTIDSHKLKQSQRYRQLPLPTK